MSRIYQRILQIWTWVFVLAPIKAYAAIAAGGALPWDQPLNTLQTDLQGPVAHAVTTAAVIGTGLTWAFSEHGTGAQDVLAGVRRGRRAWRDPAHDRAVSARRRRLALTSSPRESR